MMSFPGVLMFLVLAVISMALAHVAHVHWERIERLALWLLQHALTAKLGVPVTIKNLVLRRWSFEVHNLLIANSPGEWDAPYALQCLSLKVRFSLLGLLSVLVPNGRWGACEFLFGFRIKEVEMIEVDGLSVFLEDAKKEGKDGALPPSLKHGNLRKEPSNGFGPSKMRLLVLHPCELSWYPAGGGSANDDAPVGKPSGTLRLSEHTTVSVHDDDASPRHRFQFVVVSGSDAVTLYAAQHAERAEWVAAVREAISTLRRGGKGRVWASNAAWIDQIASEEDGKKTRRRLQAQRRRVEWQRRWAQEALDLDGEGLHEGVSEEGSSHPEGDMANGEGGGDRSVEQDATLREASSGASAANSPPVSVWHDLAKGASKWVELQMSHVSEGRVHESIEWQIGRMSVRGLTVALHKQPPLTLGAAGWHMCVCTRTGKRTMDACAGRRRLAHVNVGMGNSMHAMRVAYAHGPPLKSLPVPPPMLRRGFVGSELDLKARLLLAAPTVLSAGSATAQLQLGLAGQLLKDSAGDAARAKREEVVQEAVAAVSQRTEAVAHAVGNVQQAVAARLTSYTGKETYQFGDLTKALLTKAKRGLQGTASASSDGVPLSHEGDETPKLHTD